MQDSQREISPEERKKALEELREKMLQQKKEDYVLREQGLYEEHSRGR